MHERAVEPVAQVGAAGAGAERVVGAEHDVVGERLRAPVEELGEGLLAVLGVELVLLLDRDPGEIETLSLDLLVSRRLLGLELGELVPGRLPFLAGSNLVLRHLSSFRRTRALPREPNPSSNRTLQGSRNETHGDPETHRNCPRTAARAHGCAVAGERYGLIGEPGVPSGLRGPAGRDRP